MREQVTRGLQERVRERHQRECRSAYKVNVVLTLADLEGGWGF